MPMNAAVISRNLGPLAVAVGLIVSAPVFAGLNKGLMMLGGNLGVKAGATGLLGFFLALGFAPDSASAQSFADALVQVHNTNPRLLTERARLRATDEQLPQALSNWRPVVIANGFVGRSRSEVNPDAAGSITNYQTPRGADLTASQPVFRGFRTQAETRRADDNIAAGRAVLLATEQNVLFDAVEAYANVVRERAVLELNINNERVLARELEATQDRFVVGELTRTDVAQAESRLSRGTSDRIGAENDLATSAAQFKNIIGIAPGDLEVPLPPEALLPFSSPDAIDMATTNNPDVISAEFRESSARNDVDLIRGELLPEVTLDGVLSVDEDSSLVNGDRNRASITVNLRVPLYQSGSVYSRVREAKQVASLRMFDLADVLREAERAATDSWENLQGSRARAISFQSEVNAQEIALEGVTEEQRVGARTILDVLDAEQELLDARVGLIRAQRDALVDSYDLLSAVGRLTAKDLGLPVEVYDFTRNLDTVRNKLFGTDIGG